MDNNQYICGKQIRTRRKALGLTQAQLAEMVFVSNKAVSKWETGEANPDITLLPHLAKALHTTTDELMGISQEKNPINLTNGRKRRAFADCIKGWALGMLTVVVAAAGIFFFVSALMALDRETVTHSTGNASDQLFIILFSTVMLGGCVWLFAFLYQKARQYSRAYSYQYHSEMRKRCAEKGLVIFGDLPKEKQKQVFKEFRKSTVPQLIPLVVFAGVMLVGSMVVRLFAPQVGRLLYFGGWLVTCGLLIWLSVRRRRFFSRKKLYFKGKV